MPAPGFWTGASRTQVRLAALAVAVLALLACAGVGYLVALGPGWLDRIDLRSQGQQIALAGAFLCLIAIFKWPELGLLLLVALVYTNASEPAIRALNIPSPLQLLALGTAVAGAVRLLSRGEGRERKLILDPLLVPLALYGIVLFASSLEADNIDLADAGLAEYLRGLLIFLIVTNLATSRPMLRNVIWALVLSGAFLGSISLYQVLTGSYGQDFGGFGRVKVAEVISQSRDPRIAGPLGDPNFYGQILVMLVPLALYRLWDEHSPGRKLVAGFALAVILGAGVFTFSRGGAVALALVVPLAVLHRKIQAKYILLVLLAVAPLSLVVPERYVGRLSTLAQLAPASSEGVLSNEDSSFRDRKLLMTVALQMFADHPLLGVGAGNYSEHYAEYADHIGTTVSSDEKFGRVRYPHNLYLQIAAETGLVGLLAFAAIIAATLVSLRSAYRSFTRAGATGSADIVVSLALAITAFLATSLFLHGSYIRYLWLLVAISAAAGQIARRTAANAEPV
jgi:O-antigen ligase